MARCDTCHAKVGLLGFACPGCGFANLCARHRLPEDHACTAVSMTKMTDKSALARTLPKIVADKLVGRL